MGTLGNQTARNEFLINNDDLNFFIQGAAKIAKENETTIETVVSAKHALELERKNNIAVQSGDYTDEQVDGFGELLYRIACALENKT